MITFRQPFVGDYQINLDYGEAWPPLYTDESPHRGIDYLTPMGTPILSSADGTVTYTGKLTVGYGKHVMIQHADGYMTIYAHLDRIDVEAREKVIKGQQIGLSGTSGNSTGPHLHFEMRKNNIPIDPKPLMQTVFDPNPNNNTPNTGIPKFEAVQAGPVIVVCDEANVRCHCNMDHVIRQLHKGDVIMITDTVTMYNNLPYRDYWDGNKGCWLRIAEHDPYDQMIVNYDI